MNRGIAVLLVGLVVAGPALAGPAQVIIIRHAEKPPEGPDLSERGRERAAAYVAYFQGRPEVLQFGKPAAIYAQNGAKLDKSQRPIQTVTPLAEALKLKVIDRYHHNDFPKLARDILANPDHDGKMVLISWEHHLIPDMARAFGARDVPEKWHGSVFDRVWIITFGKDGKITFQDLPERLLFGDTEK